MAKKNLIEEALIEAKELEAASVENAKDLVLEHFKPEITEFFKDVLNEAEECDDEDEEMNEEEESDEDEEELDETDHDMGKLEDDDDETAHDLGKGFTNEEYELDEDYEIDLDEGFELDEAYEDYPHGDYDDVDGDATPESEEYLPSEDRPKVKQTGKSGWEDEGSSGYGKPGPENGKSPMPGGTPKAKQTGESGWEDEGYYDTPKKEADPEKGGKNGLDDVPTAKIVRELNRRGILEDEDIDIEDLVYEGDIYEEEDLYEEDIYEEEDTEDEDEDEVDEGYEYAESSGIFEEDEPEDGEKEELDVPEELFDEEEDDDEEDEDDEDDGVDEEVDIDVKDDDEEDKDLDEEEEVDIDVDDDDEESVNEEEEDDDEEEEVNENLYIRENGQFMRVSLDEYLDNRIFTLVERVQELEELAEELQGRLQESYVFNSKLAYMNKLFMTEAFTNSEKQRIAEKLDECDTVAEVKSLYKTIISEVQEMNPLDDFSRMIKEHTSSGGTAKTDIYESADVRRMRDLMIYETDK